MNIMKQITKKNRCIKKEKRHIFTILFIKHTHMRQPALIGLKTLSQGYLNGVHGHPPLSAVRPYVYAETKLNQTYPENRAQK